MSKNKIFKIFALLIIVIGLTACTSNGNNENGNNNSEIEKKASYKDNYYSNLIVHNKKTDTYENISIADVAQISSSNGAKFSQSYKYSKVKLVAKVYKVNYKTYYSSMTALGELDLLYLGKDSFDGALVILPTGKYDLSDVSTGDLVYVESNILYSDFDNYLTLGGVNDETTISTKSIGNTKIEFVNDKTDAEIDEMLK